MSQSQPPAGPHRSLSGHLEPAPPNVAAQYNASQHLDELHMPGVSPIDHPMPPREAPYATQRALSFDQPPGAGNSSATSSYSLQTQHQVSPYQQHSSLNSSVPNILQPAGGGVSARPPAIPSKTAPTIPTIQPPVSQHSDQHQQVLAEPQRPGMNVNTNMAHSYSRSSPAGGYDASSSNYHSYTPTTPGGGTSSSSQFMSPSDMKYGAPGSQRNISNTPLGLADIRPRADSSMSDGGPGGIGYDPTQAQPGTSNYLAPWAIYAFDWCKWAPQGNSAGKLAVGSYLEDGHNFVSSKDLGQHVSPTIALTIPDH